MYSYHYPHPALTADCVVFGYDKQQLYVLLIRRKNPPCKDMWAFPGGFMNIDEDIESCAKRELLEETGLSADSLFQLGVYSAPDRDPRERVVSVAYYTLIPLCDVCGADDAAEAEWFPLCNLPLLAFDHDEMLNDAITALKLSLRVSPVAKYVLPEQFSLQQFVDLYESLNGTMVDVDWLRSCLLDMGVIELLSNGLMCYRRLS